MAGLSRAEHVRGRTAANQINWKKIPKEDSSTGDSPVVGILNFVASSFADKYSLVASNKVLKTIATEGAAGSLITTVTFIEFFTALTNAVKVILPDEVEVDFNMCNMVNSHDNPVAT